MTQRVGIIMNGVTGRIGKNQHLLHPILAIREQGGLALPDGERLMSDPVLVVRNLWKLEALAAETGVERWSADLNVRLESSKDTIYFDSVLTQHRAANVRRAIAAGKHVYVEKPTAGCLGDALELARLASEAGVKNGVVQDKLFLPDLIKLKRLVDSGFFGRILSVRGKFGYWVFEGDWQEARRPDWNCRAEDDGGIIMGMPCHWCYVLDHLFGGVRALSCLGARHLPRCWDEQGRPYDATADDAAYALFELEGGVVAQINSSWCARVYRDEQVSFQVAGTEGSAVAGLRECRVQHRSVTPKPVWNLDIAKRIDVTGDRPEGRLGGMDFHGINGKIVSYDDARLHLSDIGFRRGYSAFDYLRIVRGCPLFLEDHLDRFENSASILGLDLPLGRADLGAHLLELIERNGVDGAGLQLFLSGGPADDGFTPVAPQLYVYLGRLPRFEPVLYEGGAKLITHRYLRDLPEAKTTNYLMAVHLSTAMRSAGAVDALYHDGERVLEATRSNLFVVTETGVLATPERDILAGVTRKNMLRALDGELEVELRDVSLAELRSAREAFLTSTTKGALPICWVDDRPVGDGRPGPVTAQVSRLFEAWLERYLMD